MLINPRVDFAFKKLFGSEENKDILVSLINAIVSAEDQVQTLELLNPYNNKEHRYDKFSILDIKATDKKGRKYNIEMQITDQVHYNQRVLYYWSKLYTSQLQEGMLFSELKKTISINILNFNYFEKEVDYHNVFKILHMKSHQSYFADLELHFIELNKFNKKLTHVKTALDRWVSFLNKAHGEGEKLPKELAQEPAIVKAFQTLTHLSMDADGREVYEGRLKWLRDEAAALEKKFEEGKIEGKMEGKIEGKIEMIKKQLRRGVSLEIIAEDSGLSMEELIKIQNEF